MINFYWKINHQLQSADSHPAKQLTEENDTPLFYITTSLLFTLHTDICIGFQNNVEQMRADREMLPFGSHCIS